MTADEGRTSEAEPIITMRGVQVAVGPMHQGMIPLMERWFNDFRTLDLNGDDIAPQTHEMFVAQWEPLLRGERADWVGFALYSLPELQPIGIANVRDFTNVHGTAEIGISIGEPVERGRGLGTEAVQMLLDYAFTTLGVFNVWLDTLSYNEAAIRAYEKAGFREIGRRRGAHLLGGKRYDTVLMDCIVSEFVPPPVRVLPDNRDKRAAPTV